MKRVCLWNTLHLYTRTEMFIHEQSVFSGCLSVEFSTASQDGLQSLCVRATEACCLTAAITVEYAGKVMIETAR